MDMHRWAAAACLGHAAEDQQATVHDHAAEDQDTAAQTLPHDAPAATFPRLPSEGLRAAI